MERLTWRPFKPLRWIIAAIAFALILPNPSIPAGIVSTVTSLITWPIKGELLLLSADYSIFGDGYAVYNFQLMLIFIIAALGLNVIMMSGLLSLAHGALIGIGAYAFAVSYIAWKMPFAASVSLAILLPAIVGAVLALPSKKLGTFALGMITLGFAGLFQALVLNAQGLTGGGNGISYKVTEGWLAESNGLHLYWMI